MFVRVCMCAYLGRVPHLRYVSVRVHVAAVCARLHDVYAADPSPVTHAPAVLAPTPQPFYTYKHTHTRTHIHTHTLIHAHAHTHIHAHTRAPPDCRDECRHLVGEQLVEHGEVGGQAAAGSRHLVLVALGVWGCVWGGGGAVEVGG